MVVPNHFLCLPCVQRRKLAINFSLLGLLQREDAWEHSAQTNKMISQLPMPKVLIKRAQRHTFCLVCASRNADSSLVRSASSARCGAKTRTDTRQIG